MRALKSGTTLESVRSPVSPKTGKGISAEQRQDEENALLKPKDKIDFLFKVINRFDFYTNTTNTKASLIIAWNGALIGAVLLKYSEILNTYQPAGWIKVAAITLLLLVGTCSVVSNVLVLKAVFPFLRSSSRRATSRILQSESMLFFGSVAAMGTEIYHRGIADSDVDEILTDLADQAVTIAQGLRDKMLVIQKSLAITGLGLIFIFCLIILKAATI